MTHATIEIGEYKIPLLFVPPSAVMEDCDCCGKDFHIQKILLTGSQFLCPKCRDNGTPPANTTGMKIQLDIKSIVIGLALGVGAMLTMADSTGGSVGRYQVSTGANFIVIVDTATGEAFGHPTTTDGQGSDRGGKFWEPKN